MASVHGRQWGETMVELVFFAMVAGGLVLTDESGEEFSGNYKFYYKFLATTVALWLAYRFGEFRGRKGISRG